MFWHAYCLAWRHYGAAGNWTSDFLIVRGELRTYRIHLGSGNILMDPNSQYLCIVPGRGPVLAIAERTSYRSKATSCFR